MARNADTMGDPFKLRFVQVYEEIKKEILQKMVESDRLPGEIAKELVTYYEKCIDYTCTGGKMTRGMAVAKATEAAYGSNDNQEETKVLTEDLYKKSAVLGWCVEILQAFFLVADDVMDHSVTRRSLPCWYRVGGVTASNAINDALFLNTSIYWLLKKYFGGSKEYVKLMEQFVEGTSTTLIGQYLDTNAQPFCDGGGEMKDASNMSNNNCANHNNSDHNDAMPPKEFDISRVTMTRYRAIVLHKTAYYSFYLPCALGMILAGMEEQRYFKKVEDVCMKLGEYFQIQDDYLDCFADPVLLGKIGTDIQENKCSWLLVQAIQRASEEEKKMLSERYGKKEKEKVEWVKSLYRKLNLEEVYRNYEEQAKTDIEEVIKGIDHRGLQGLMHFFLSKIYRREK